MISIEYQPNAKELAKATLSYVEKIPLIKLLLIIISISCWLVLFAYLLKFCSFSLTGSDNVSALLAIIWLFFRKKINEVILKLVLKKRKVNQLTSKVQFTKQRITWTNTKNNLKHLPWGNVKKILINKKGYIIPKILDAPLNCTFIWIPKTSFKSENDEEKFLQIIKNNNIKLLKAKF